MCLVRFALSVVDCHRGNPHAPHTSRARRRPSGVTDACPAASPFRVSSYFSLSTLLPQHTPSLSLLLLHPWPFLVDPHPAVSMDFGVHLFEGWLCTPARLTPTLLFLCGSWHMRNGRAIDSLGSREEETGCRLGMLPKHPCSDLSSSNH